MTNEEKRGGRGSKIGQVAGRVMRFEAVHVLSGVLRRTAIVSMNPSFVESKGVKIEKGGHCAPIS